MRRAIAVGVIVLAAAAASAAGRPPPVSPAFDRVSAIPGDRVTVRAGGLGTRRPLRVYLVPRGEARLIRSRFDRRLHFVGVLVPRRGRASFAFTVPPLPTGHYTAWCTGCRSRAALRVTMPQATAETCPVTVPTKTLPRQLAGGSWVGNGLLWTWQPAGGVWNVDPRLVQPDGTLFNKQIWVARPMFGNLDVRLERLDELAPVVQVVTVPGTYSIWAGPSWASRMRFPAGGCWLVRGRVADIALSYVVSVVPPPS